LLCLSRIEHIKTTADSKLIWNTEENKLIEKFTGHRDGVTGLVFRQGTHELYSASLDRAVKIWNCDTMSYVTTCFGHLAPITGIDAFQRERCFTSSLDKTIRLWKIAEQTQLVFSGPVSALECVVYLTDSNCVSGSQDGSIDLWSIQKKKPIFTIKQAHGSGDGGSISAIASIPFSDIFATGSGTGQIKLWKWEQNRILHIRDIPFDGWINDLRFSSSGKYLVVGVGKDQKLGRWLPLNVPLGIAVIDLSAV